MRTRPRLTTTALTLALTTCSLLVGCGDDSPTPTGGSGGTGGTGGQGGALGGGGSGGDGGSATLYDNCEAPGQLAVGLGETVSIDGVMDGAADDYRMFCADSTSQPGLEFPELVYAISVGADCSARFTVEGFDGVDAVLGLRTEGCDLDEYCRNSAVDGEEDLRVPLQAGDYFLVVADASGGAAGGSFTLTAQCATPACGDGVHNEWTGEECDDGNANAGDGCDPDCFYEAAPPELDTCAGATASVGISIDLGQLLRVPASAPPATTVGATNSGESTCQTAAFTGPAPDHVYKVIPDSNGTLIASVGLDFNGDSYCGDTEPMGLPFGCWDRAVHIREATCDDSQGEIACSDDPDQWWRVEVASGEVIAGTEYYVFVDGYNADEYGEGPYVLQLELQ